MRLWIMGMLACVAAGCIESAGDGGTVARGTIPVDTTAVQPPLRASAAGVDLSALDPVVRRHVERVGPDALVRWGACPFECCVYRDWVAESDVPVRSEPRSDAELLVTLPSGTRFHADTGFVRVTSPQVVVVTEPLEAYLLSADDPAGGTPTTLAPGDSLLVLEYEGEGHYILMRGDDLLSAPQFWPSTDGDWPPADQLRGDVIGEHEAEWWAHVRTDAGVEGWIDAYAAELGNVDACGMPA